MVDDQKKDLRVSGPLDRRLANINFDYEDRSIPPDRNPPGGNPFVGASKLDQTRFSELIEEFRSLIGMPELELTDPNCCTIDIGEREENTIPITIELRGQDMLLLFATMESYAGGVTKEIEARVELLNASQQGENYYLSTSKNSVFLCSEKKLSQTTSTRFGDWVTEFYKQAISWRGRYRNVGSAPVVTTPLLESQPAARTTESIVSAPLRIPLRGLKV